MAFHFSKRKLRPQEPDDVGELNIVPYLDIMMNLIMFMLLSMTGLISFSVLNVAAPKYAPAAPAAVAADPSEKPKLLLTVLVSEKGFFIAGAGGVLGENTAADGSGAPTIPKLRGEYDFAALTAKMTDIKKAFPEESKTILGADPKVSYETLVRTMDACRENPAVQVEGKPMTLFFDVSLTVM
jgi:biopolymer transport protein TolR